MRSYCSIFAVTLLFLFSYISPAEASGGGVIPGNEIRSDKVSQELVEYCRAFQRDELFSEDAFELCVRELSIRFPVTGAFRTSIDLGEDPIF
jgi:hypothetical protein